MHQFSCDIGMAVDTHLCHFIYQQTILSNQVQLDLLQTTCEET